MLAAVFAGKHLPSSCEASGTDGNEVPQKSNYQQEAGGIVRGLFRSIVKRAAGSNLGSIPNPKVIVKASEKLSDLLEIREQLKVATYDVATPVKEERIFSKVCRISIAAAPGFVKNSFLGAILFSSYDYGLGLVALDDKNRSALSTPKVFSIGACAGIAHASFYILWDLLLTSVQSRVSFGEAFRRIPYSIEGTITSHSVVHASLFSVYYGMKTSFDWYLSEPGYHHQTLLNARTVISPVLGSMSAEEETAVVRMVSKASVVSISGACAAIVSEVFGYYLSSVEDHGWNGVRQVLKTPRPPFRLIIPAAIPGALGFLAYEFEKENLNPL